MSQQTKRGIVQVVGAFALLLAVFLVLSFVLGGQIETRLGGCQTDPGMCSIRP